METKVFKPGSTLKEKLAAVKPGDSVGVLDGHGGVWHGVARGDRYPTGAIIYGSGEHVLRFEDGKPGVTVKDLLYCCHLPEPEPPRPKEPTGLGAVVQNDGGNVYFRTSPTRETGVWQDRWGTKRHWEELHIVREDQIKFEGVQF